MIISNHPYDNMPNSDPLTEVVFGTYENIGSEEHPNLKWKATLMQKYNEKLRQFKRAFWDEREILTEFRWTVDPCAIQPWTDDRTDACEALRQIYIQLPEGTVVEGEYIEQPSTCVK